MKKPSCHDELTIRHRFDRLCQMSLKGEAINYYRHMDYRREHEAMFSELSEKELNQLFVMDEYGVENSHFTVHGYDIEVKGHPDCGSVAGTFGTEAECNTAFVFSGNERCGYSKGDEPCAQHDPRTPDTLT